MCGQLQKLLGCKYVYSGASSKHDGFVRDAFAGRKGWPFGFRQKRRWDARELAFLSHSARAAL